MFVFFITQKYMGEKVLLKPRTPETAPKSEGKEPIICVPTSILGALSSIGENLYLDCCTYIYCANISADDNISQPIHIGDYDFTGELWLQNEKQFSLYETIRIEDENDFHPRGIGNGHVYNFVFKEVENPNENSK